MNLENKTIDDSNESNQKGKDNFLLQYKIFVEMMDSISRRRHLTNQFYISLITALIAIATFVGENLISEGEDIEKSIYILFPLTLTGIIFCILWRVNIQAYRYINKAKFTVILEMEEQLPYPCYDKEWQKLKKEKYISLTIVERLVPFAMMIPFISFILYLFIV